MKRILVVWPVYREDWVQVFKDLSGEFHFTFLAGIFQEGKNYVEKFAETVFWSSYGSAQSILNEINPNVLIFMSIDNGLSMVLNHSAKKKCIPTFILQHGIYTNYRDYRGREKIWRKREVANRSDEQKKIKGFNTLKFSLASLIGVDKFRLFGILVYSKAQKYVGPYWASRHFPLDIKKADKYLCFSPFNSIIHREIDKINDSNIIYIGCVELEKYLVKVDSLIQERFYLHIDQALAENSLGEETISKSEMSNFYLKLNEFCKDNKAKLYIKLHPESYKSEWLPEDDNIVYLRRIENFNTYIQSALGCFGLYSTMIIPAIYWNPTILFEVQYSGLQEALSEKIGNRVLDFWNFTVSDITFNEEYKYKSIIKKLFITPDKKMNIVAVLNKLT